MLRWTWLSAVIIIADQLTKWMAVERLSDGTVSVVNRFLNMRLRYNEGVAFSFGDFLGEWQRWIFSILGVVVCVILISWVHRLSEKAKWMAVSLSLIIGGAIGNLVDRIFMGKVVDFIDVHFPLYWVSPDYHFATFNIADIAISIGAVLLILIMLFNGETE
ncbi:MAG TPA: signal peptidase II [Thiotrichaceae bacterium]|nr:signal peptidase II [Thiotrichaceae bacterium]